MPIKIKFCGFTNQKDLEIATQLPIDYVGFIVNVMKSPRMVSLAQATYLATTVKESSKKKTVAVVVDLDPDLMQKIVDNQVFDVVQFHGQETPDTCKKWKKQIEVWKVFELTAGGGDKIIDRIKSYKNVVDKILLDLPKQEQALGEEGRVEVFEKVKLLELPVILAGGLTPQNVRQKICRYKPFGVDVAGGIELIKSVWHGHGKKDPEKMKQFTQEVFKAGSKTEEELWHGVCC